MQAQQRHKYSYTLLECQIYFRDMIGFPAHSKNVRDRWVFSKSFQDDSMEIIHFLNYFVGDIPVVLRERFINFVSQFDLNVWIKCQFEQTADQNRRSRFKSSDEEPKCLSGSMVNFKNRIACNITKMSMRFTIGLVFLIINRADVISMSDFNTAVAKKSFTYNHHLLRYS